MGIANEICNVAGSEDQNDVDINDQNDSTESGCVEADPPSDGNCDDLEVTVPEESRADQVLVFEVKPKLRSEFDLRHSVEGFDQENFRWLATQTGAKAGFYACSG